MSTFQFYVSVVLTPALTLAVVMIGILVNNARLSDLRSEMNSRFNEMSGRFNDMNGRFGDLRDLLRAEIARSYSELRAEIAKNHSELLSKISQLDQRMSAMEARLEVEHPSVQ